MRTEAGPRARFRIYRIVFEWDPGKAARHLEKHGVTFFEAASVFTDPEGLDLADDAHSKEIGRWRSDPHHQRAGLEPQKGPRTRGEIDFSDIPELTEAQLARARRVGRPPLGRAARELIAIRVDPDVLRSLRVEATRAGIGYQTLIHKLLAAHVRKSA